MDEETMLLVMAVLVQKLGGAVEVTRNELFDAQSLTLWRTENNTTFVDDGIKFTVEDNTILQGVVL